MEIRRYEEVIKSLVKPEEISPNVAEVYKFLANIAKNIPLHILTLQKPKNGLHGEKWGLLYELDTLRGDYTD